MHQKLQSYLGDQKGAQQGIEPGTSAMQTEGREGVSQPTRPRTTYYLLPKQCSQAARCMLGQASNWVQTLSIGPGGLVGGTLHSGALENRNGAGGLRGRLCPFWRCRHFSTLSRGFALLPRAPRAKMLVPPKQCSPGGGPSRPGVPPLPSEHCLAGNCTSRASLIRA